ncbi:hypothetical protein CHLRE_12g503000v5 [Chlamydomonas reinhardtii]|uniref:Major facilitator superfamily (MFS) profile domain-containing protein n=1 Tax=Chlamydomonas reinhardtii TaxID=3055 RepID=A8IJH7_CHLRE|nr:uncharacterized protein CHLRE_12g503000v5 [Chlamydomonas reinhardtii]PNW74950.1 hypothetical protein CHLRE_12g503000v5 [Chlamydomonas reinhardtii]|eukprot:XP_001690795.1 glycerol-3-phosphate permease-like protein [Chlamydomonas reinhardtii]
MAKKNVPPGLEILHACYGGKRFSYNWYKGSVLVLTFLCYMGYHAARKPPSIVKSVLRGSPPVIGKGRSLLADGGLAISVSDPTTLNGWYPFNGDNGQTLLGQIDLAFLGTYAIGMFFAGHLGDRLDLRWFLTVGMIGSGIFTSLFGMGYFWDTHMFAYYTLVSVAAGLFQSTGWPSVVSIVANWSGKGKRGLIMGIWNAHTSVGNILGTVIAAAMLSEGWGYSFIVPGFLMIALGVLMWAGLVVQPSDVGHINPDDKSGRPNYEEELVPLGGVSGSKADAALERKDSTSRKEEPESIHFMDAWRIPGVASFAFCLFFSKLIAYTFLYWLPYYIKSTPIEGRKLDAKEAGDLSVLFDVGGVAGGVLAGHLSDKSGASACVATAFTLLSVPCLYMYRTVGHTSFALNTALMMASGFFVNGPYALITTAVSADLGTHDSLQGNAKALATVSAIIDGMGSLGAALGPMMTGFISDRGGFDMVFMMLYVSAVTAGALLVKLVAKELQLMSTRGAKPI